jgi:hypothetical protein
VKSGHVVAHNTRTSELFVTAEAVTR